MPKIETTPMKAKPSNGKNGHTGKPSAKPGKPERPVIYPDVVTRQCWAGADGPITAADMRQILQWETEGEFIARMTAEKPDLTEVECRAEFSVHCVPDYKTLAGERVTLWANLKNRLLRLSHAYELGQSVLTKQWAGPTSMPGQTVNGDALRIGRTGIVVDGQHRGFGFIDACDKWLNGDQATRDHWRKYWQEEPVLESLVVFGVSEDDAVVQTMDNTMSRTIADTIYTADTGLFPHLSKEDRRWASKLLGQAADMLWQRTAASQQEFEGYKTIQAELAFIKAHPRLTECVEHIYAENKSGKIGDLELNPGHCAALMYLQAASATDGHAYRAVEPWAETTADLTRWDKAKNFWVRLVAGEMPKIGEALGRLRNVETNAPARPEEKYAVLAHAWNAFAGMPKLSGPKTADWLDGNITLKTMRLKYDTDGSIMDPPTFGGIDLGMKFKAADREEGAATGDEPDLSEIEKIEMRKQQAEIAKKLLMESGGKTSKAPGEVGDSKPVQYDKDGKPPAPKLIKRK